MDCLITFILLLVLSILYAGSVNDYNQHLVLLFFVFLVISVSVYAMNTNQMTRENFTTLAPVNYKISPNTCDGIDYSEVSKGHNKLSDTYDGLILKENKPKYEELPNNHVAYHAPNGDAYSLNLDLPAGQEPLFLFSHNKSHPSCCPSTYSSSRGCVCLTEEQKKLIGGRK